MLERSTNCILCPTEATAFFVDDKTRQTYFHCRNCDLRFLDPTCRLNAKEEHDRYKNHNNDVTDPRYQKFVEPMFQLIKAHIPKDGLGLDYGCGDGPVLAHLLSEDGYHVNLYDPFFRPNESALNLQYDFIFAVEVVEHFFNPMDEFTKLKSLLKSDGSFLVMTLIYDDKVEFSDWYYRKDPTHVAFYSAKTLFYISHQFNFETHTIHGDRIAWFRGLKS